MFDLARPWVLLFLIPLGVIIWRNLRTPGPTLPQLLPERWAVDLSMTLRPPAPWFLRMGALIVLLVALAGPRVLSSASPSGRGLAGMLVLDLSGSMAALDMDGRSRLDVARGELRRFILERPGDLLGLVTFARSAVTRVPATTDHRYLLRVLDELEVDSEADGTAIGTGLGLAAHRVSQAPSPSRILILITDGRNNSGFSDPRSVAVAAGALDIKIHTIGVGRSGTTEPPDEGLLREVAESTGGTFFRALDLRGFREVLSRIGAMEKSPIPQPAFQDTRPAHAGFLWCGIVLLLLENLFWAMPGRRVL